MRTRLAVYTLLLFAAWYFNLNGIPDGMAWARSGPRFGYLGNDSQLVLARLAQPDAPPLSPLVNRSPDGQTQPYRSQFGLTGVVLAAVRPLTGLGATEFAVVAGAVFALLAALTVAAVLAVAHRTLGPPTGDVACVLATCAPVFLPFAPSLYWAFFLLLAPFASVWCLLPRATTPARRVGLLTGVALLVAMKALCGYEYITAVILAPVAAAWFHQHRRGEPLRNRVVFAGALVAAGLVGFALAIVLHAVQIQAVFGDDGFAVIRDRALVRTTGDPSGELGGQRPAPTACFWAYFEQRTLSLPATVDLQRIDVSLGVVTAVALGLVVVTIIGRRWLPKEAGALAGAVVLALAAGASWQVLAVNHMCVHWHLNQIVYAVPFLPVAFMAIGFGVRLAVSRAAAGPWVGVATLTATAALMAANVGLTLRDGKLEQAEQASAEAVVAKKLGGPAPQSQRVAGCIDPVRPAAAIPAALLLEHGWLNLATADAADADAVVLQGWAIGDWKMTRRPTARVVVTVGGTVVGCDVLRFGRPDVNRNGRPLCGAGFVLAIPSAALKPGEPVRVFAVSGRDPNEVTEITPPGGITVGWPGQKAQQLPR